MMRRLLLFVLAVVCASAEAGRGGRFERTNSRTPQGRSDRGFPGDDYAFFEFAPASGAGMTAPCACTTPTGAKGEALTFTRGSSATCTKTSSGGLATSGIANGDLVTCTSNQPRIEYGSAGVLGLLVESARTNVLLRSDALTNAAWADVGTPNATDGATDPFGGTTGDTLTDDAAGAFEGRSQVVTVTAATAYIMSCYIKGTTSSKARLSLDGTTCDASGLSATTWSFVTCADASSSGVSISAQVLVGNAVGDTGDIVVGGCQVEAGTYATSYMATGAASAARSAESAYLTIPSTPVRSFSSTTLAGSGFASNARVGVTAWESANVNSEMYTPATASPLRCFQLNSPSNNDRPTVGNITMSASNRLACYYSPSVEQGAVLNGTATTGAATLAGTSAATRAYIGCYYGGAGYEVDGVVSLVCVDPNPSRCR